MKEKILDSIGSIDDDLIESVDALRREKRFGSAWIRWVAIAACLCLIAGGIFLWQKAAKPSTQDGGIVLSADGVTIPKREVSLAADRSAEMIGFFIYHGNCYVYYERTDAADIVGEYLGTATGLIDEWTPRDGYVELAGSVKGDFYAVKGYDPGFMLCMKEATGAVTTYVCGTGFTVKIGAELYEDRLHLSDRYESLQYETRSSWNYDRQELYRMNGNEEVIGSFIEQLDKAEFIPWKDIPLKEGMTETSIYDTEIYHVYFKMEDGTTVHLRLYENGYVRWQGLLDVCVLIPEDSFRALTDVMKNHSSAEKVILPSRLEIDLEKCRNDSELGAFVPTYEIPNTSPRIAEVYYYLEPGTGIEMGTKEIYLEYDSESDPELYYSVTVTWREEYGKNGWAGPMMDHSELSIESIAERIGTKDNGTATIDIGLWYDDVSVVLSASGTDAESVFELFESVEYVH